MSAEIKFQSDNTISLTGPTNTEDDALSSGGTCTARLFHDRKDTYLTQISGAVGSNILRVFDPYLYETGVDNIRLQKNDLTWFDCGLVVAVSDVSVTVTNSHSEGSIRKGAAVRAQIGPTITMLSYGTPQLNTYNWGYRGRIEHDHAALSVGTPIRIEITLTDTGIVLNEVIKAVVVGGS